MLLHESELYDLHLSVVVSASSTPPLDTLNPTYCDPLRHGCSQGRADLRDQNDHGGARNEGLAARCSHGTGEIACPADQQTPIVSLVTTQTELLAHEVYLTDRIDK